MHYYKKEMSAVLKSMIIESLEFVKAHIDWITNHELEDPMMDQVSRQLRNHLMVLHWSFPIIRRLFEVEELTRIISMDLLDRIEKIYIEGLKSGGVLPCKCDYCVEFPVKEIIEEKIEVPIKKKVQNGK